MKNINNLLEDILDLNIIEVIKDINNINFDCGLISGMIIGSVAKGLFKQDISDIDLLFLHADNFDEKEVIKFIRNEGYDVINYNELYSINGYKHQINICYKNSKDFVDLIKNILNGEEFEAINRSWVIGGEIKDVLLQDLENVIIFFNKNQELENFLKNINNSKIEFFKKSVDFLSNELSDKIKLCKLAIERKEFLLVYIGFGEIVCLLSRLHCSRNQIYNPGLKHIIKDKEFIEYYELAELLLDDYNMLKIIEYIDKLELILVRQ
jgi:tRNA nucleotidyltransferase (CCA-adding enzyme)